ncbi:MAG: MFS transporter [Fimbriimonadaceae bacterium]|nr:MFS transporter [Fimbriimonadaceae bacterium]
MDSDTGVANRPGFWGMSRYQWTVLFAAWLGWGFDVFDGLLFNYVAPNCVPTLLGIPIGTQQAKEQTSLWIGLLTSLLLVGWGVGGILFGRVADRIGRTKALMLTMAMYALGTAACAFAPNMAFLVVCRVIASLGIGGEWAAGAAMVAEVVPEKRRVEAGAILYTSAPAGLFLATYVTHQVQGVHLVGSPETSWRTVFLFGLVPAAVAFLVRLFVKEPEKWSGNAVEAARAGIRDLFTPEFRRVTWSGLGMALVALVMWWACNAFNPQVATLLAQARATAQGLGKEATQMLIEEWKAVATTWFNVGGLLGTLLTVVFAKTMGRKPMYFIYFVASAAAIFTTYGAPAPDEVRLSMFFFMGLTVFGVFGSFTYYLPELYPTRLRATGAGFCYNAGRFVAAAGPPLVGLVMKSSSQPLQAIAWVAVVPLLGLFVVPFIVETKSAVLAD